MARSTTRSRLGTTFLVMTLLTLTAVAVARNQSQPETKMARSLTFGELATDPLEPSEGASTAPPWFRITFDTIRTDGPKPALVDPNPAPSLQEETVPEAVQNLHRVDRH